MPGERVLLVESSAAVQELAKSVLEENGYKVTAASNGVAALNHPDLQNFNLMVVDAHLEGVDGMDVSAQIRSDAETYGIPVLLLIPEAEIEQRASQSLRGANGYLAKPFTPAQLRIKAKELLDEQRLREVSSQFLEQSADKHMQELAEQKIQQAVERKIQIIVERAIQSIVSIIDQRARREVEGRVTALVAEKEQELVRLTVQEVARSMVEKIAEKKVTEAMEAILADETEKTVRRTGDTILPSMVRERLREAIDSVLPREVQTRVDKAAQEKMPELSEALVTVLQNEAKRTVPIVAKEKVPEIAERQVATACDQRIPQLVTNEARNAIQQELQMRIRPLIDEQVNSLRKQVILWGAIISATVLVIAVVGILLIPYLAAR